MTPTWEQASERIEDVMSAEQHAADWSSFIDRAMEAGADGILEQAQGWDVWFEKQWICRCGTREAARRTIRAIKADPSLAVVFQVHES